MIFVFLGIFLIIVAGGFLVFKNIQSQKDKILKGREGKEIALPSRFADYKEEIPINIVSRVPYYAVKSDLSNVSNAKDFVLYDFSPSAFSKKEREMLVQNAFFVRPAKYNEFFPLYEENRYYFIPNFITTDSVLHTYHLLFSFLLRRLEEEQLMRELKKLSVNMLQESLAQYKKLRGTEWENAARRNIGFFAVGSRLLDSSIRIPSIVETEVNRELLMIEFHKGIKLSPVMNIGSKKKEIMEDYSQYIPRGHYSKTENLKKYFKAMTWYSRMTFRVENEDEVKSAILIALALDQIENYNSWNKIYETIGFFVGKTDDIDYYQLKKLIKKVYGDNTSPERLAKNKDKFFIFIEELKILPSPQIESIPVFQEPIQTKKERERKGFRFLGQKFTIDAFIFQKLIYPEVGDKTQTCQEFDPAQTSCLLGARCLPKGLDIPAAMGSKEALGILKEEGETQYACYSKKMNEIKNFILRLPKETWTQNLYWAWFYQLKPLLEVKGKGYPVFMQNKAWMRKELNTFLGSWAELKHDTILYSKQTYAELGAGRDLSSPPDDRGYVEPNPYVYARLVALLRMTKEGLGTRDFLSPKMKANLEKMEKLVMSLKTISEKELNNEKLTDEEYELIRSYGGQLEHFWIEVNKDEPAYKKSSSWFDYLQQNPAAIIADVATDPNGKILEVGTGKIFEIYVIVPIDGDLRIAKGGVYSYYEFEGDMSNRLTDEEWRELLNSENPPNLPNWSEAFIAK